MNLCFQLIVLDRGIKLASAVNNMNHETPMVALA